MIEIRKDYQSKREALLFVDGIFIEKAFPGLDADNSSCHVHTIDSYSSRQVAAHSLSEFPAPPKYLHLCYYPDDIEHFDKDDGIFISGTFLGNKATGKYSIYASIGGSSLSVWRAAYSFSEYAYEMYQAIKLREDVEVVQLLDKEQHTLGSETNRERDTWTEIEMLKEINEGRIHALGLEFSYTSLEVKIADEVARISKIISEVNKEVISLLLSCIHSGSLVVAVDFPEEVKVSCEQYLLYFVQFLKDIGIEATAELRHEASTVLFSITPKDKSEALNHIRRALEVYLTLPTNPNLNATFGLTNDPRTQQLVANIQHLQSQLVLANAVMQLKDATIQQQQVTIQQQRHVTGEILIESVKIDNPDEESQDKEKILGGAVAITKFKWKFLEFDTPDIWRRIKQFVFETDES